MFSEISKISLKLSGFCNLACVYCHQLARDKKSLDSFDQFPALLALLKDVRLADTVDITITGGEVTTFPELFEKAVKMFRKIERMRDVRFNIGIVSNGTNIPQIIDWLDRGFVTPNQAMISWDGLHSSSLARKSKNELYDDAYFLAAIKAIGASKYAKEIYVTHAVTPETLPFLADSYRYALDAGIRSMGHYYIHEADYSAPGLAELYREQLVQIAELYCLRYPTRDSRFVYWNWTAINSKQGLSKADILAASHCQKLGRTLHVDQHGDLYGCLYFGDHNAFKLGTVSEGYDTNQLTAFMDSYRQIPDCAYAQCSELHCFECPAANYVTNGAMHKRFSNTCRLLAVEREVYVAYFPSVQLDPIDMIRHLRDDEISGTKGIHGRQYGLEDIGIPYSDLELQSDTPIPSNTLRRVKTWRIVPK